LLDFFYFREHLFIVGELLKDNLYEFQRFTAETGGDNYFHEANLRKIARQILEALDFVHSLGLIHCDVKPENILIKSFSKVEVKLIDFGSSCFATDTLTTYVQSRAYRAPEVILGCEYGPAIDIWSLGCVLAELLTGRVLFENASLAHLLCKMSAVRGPFPAWMVREGVESNKYFKEHLVSVHHFARESGKRN
jgi:serine/threonine protein kinase